MTRIIFYILSLVLLSSCKKDYKRVFTRTFDSPKSFTIKEQIPLYRQECSTVSSLGSQYQCGAADISYDNCYYDRHGRRFCGIGYKGHHGFGRRGFRGRRFRGHHYSGRSPSYGGRGFHNRGFRRHHGFRGHYRNSPLCSEQLCQQVFVKNFETSLTLNFDEEAKLDEGQIEDYKLEGTYDNGQFVGKLKIKSKHHKYEKISKVYLQNGDKKSIDIKRKK